MNVTVVPYNPQWPNWYASELERLSYALGNTKVRSFHVGSTAVQGLAARPIIDIMLVVTSLAELDEKQAQFEELGYECLGEFGIAGRRYMRKGEQERTHQVHAFQYDDMNNILRHLAFRNYLRQHGEVKEVYETLKIRLEAENPKDAAAYNQGKEAFMQTVEEDALKWFWNAFGMI